MIKVDVTGGKGNFKLRVVCETWYRSGSRMDQRDFLSFLFGLEARAQPNKKSQTKSSATCSSLTYFNHCAWCINEWRIHCSSEWKISLKSRLSWEFPARVKFCWTPLFNYAKYAVHCRRFSRSQNSLWLCGTKAFSHKPPRPRSMKMLFTSSHNWKRNGLTMFSRVRLLGNFLAFVLPLDMEKKSSRMETFDSIADSNCFKEHRAEIRDEGKEETNLNHANLPSRRQNKRRANEIQFVSNQTREGEDKIVQICGKNF